MGVLGKVWVSFSSKSCFESVRSSKSILSFVVSKIVNLEVALEDGGRDSLLIVRENKNGLKLNSSLKLYWEEDLGGSNWINEIKSFKKGLEKEFQKDSKGLLVWFEDVNSKPKAICESELELWMNESGGFGTVMSEANFSCFRMYVLRAYANWADLSVDVCTMKSKS